MYSADKRRVNEQKNKAKIMEAAIQLFQEYGYENVTVDQIVKAAGFSKGTFYKLFFSKDDIVVSYMEQWNDLYAKYYEEHLADSAHDPLEKLRLLLQYMLEISTKGGQELERITISSSMRDQVMAEKISKSGAPITSILQQLLTDGIAQGCVSQQFSVDALVDMLYMLLDGINLKWAKQFDDQPLSDISVPAIQLFIEMIQTKKESGT